jgi:hypothetical protein
MMSSSSRQHGSIVVMHARHSFTWTKQPHNNNNDSSQACVEWRQRGRRHRRPSQGETTNAWNEAALTRLEHALAVDHDSHGNDPRASFLWGPVDDPISNVTVHVEWESSSRSNSSSNDDNHKTNTMETALLTLPLKIRSQNVSWSDVDDMEHSLQRTIFHPILQLNHGTTNECRVSAVEWDTQTAVTTAAASCKCVLASLIRVSEFYLVILVITYTHLSPFTFFRNYVSMNEFQIIILYRYTKIPFYDTGLQSHDHQFRWSTLQKIVPLITFIMQPRLPLNVIRSEYNFKKPLYYHLCDDVGLWRFKASCLFWVAKMGFYLQ